MHRVISSAAALPLRLLLITVLMAGLAFASDRHCADHTLTAATATIVHVDHSHTSAGHHSPDQPGDLLGLCMSILAAITAPLILIGGPGRLRSATSGLHAFVACLSQPQPRLPALSVLCVSRT